MKKDAYYFSHDANARNDVKCIKLRRELGAEGYGIYWMLIEQLREQPEHRIPLTSMEDIAYDFHVSKEKLEAVIMRYNLFKIDVDMFFSHRLLRSMESYKNMAKVLSESGKKGNAIRWASGGDREAIAGQSQIKESKVKESKEDNINTEAKASTPKFIKPEFVEIENYFLELGHQDQSQKFLDHYTSNGWKVGRNPMKDWKAAARNWVNNKKNYSNGNNKSVGAGNKQAGAYELLEKARDQFATRRA